MRGPERTPCPLRAVRPGDGAACSRSPPSPSRRRAHGATRDRASWAPSGSVAASGGALAPGGFVKDLLRGNRLKGVRASSVGQAGAGGTGLRFSDSPWERPFANAHPALAPRRVTCRPISSAEASDASVQTGESESHGLRSTDSSSVQPGERTGLLIDDTGVGRVGVGVGVGVNDSRGRPRPGGFRTSSEGSSFRAPPGPQWFSGWRRRVFDRPRAGMMVAHRRSTRHFTPAAG